MPGSQQAPSGDVCSGLDATLLLLFLLAAPKGTAATCGGSKGSKGPGRPSSPQRLDRLSGLADQMVARGNLGVYQETRERLAMQLKGLGCRTQGPPDPISQPSLDMFAEEVAEGELETPTPVQRGGEI